MNILSIDLGHYSVKFLEGHFENKHGQFEYLTEVVLDDFVKDHGDLGSVENLHLSIVKDYLQKRKFDGKIILIVPDRFLTYRFFTLPVKSKKKALQMVPFHLDRELLLNTSEAHFATQVIKQKNNSFCSSSITSIPKFEQFYRPFEKSEILPQLLTSHGSVLQGHLLNKRIEGNLCLIDLGHQSTKAFFILGSKVVTYHSTEIGLKIIDEMLCQEYSLSPNDARLYKHEKCVFLTEGQEQDANEEQRLLQKNLSLCLTPLIETIHNWILGHQVNYAKEIDSVYLSGGGALIRNFDFYLSQKISKRVLKWETFNYEQLESLQISRAEQIPFNYACMNFMTYPCKYPPVNFRFGKFSTADDEEIPLHSAVFIGQRVMAVTFIVILGLLIEKIFLYVKDNDINVKLDSALKQKELTLLSKYRTRHRSYPEMVLGKVQTRSKEIRSEKNSIEKYLGHKGPLSLVKMAQMIRLSDKEELLKVESVNGLITATFLSPIQEEREFLKQKLHDLGWPKAQISEQASEKKIIFSFEEA